MDEFNEEKEEDIMKEEKKIMQNLRTGEKNSQSLSLSKKCGKDDPTDKQLEALLQSGFNSSLALKSNYNLRDSFLRSERVNSMTEDRNCCYYCNLV